MTGPAAGWRIVPVLLAGLALSGAPGCTNLKSRASATRGVFATYLDDRAKDALDIFAIGLSFTKTSQFALYADGASVVPIGFGRVDGYLCGIGNGNIGRMRFYQSSIGLMGWGYEEVAFGEFDKTDLTTVDYQGVGVLGLVMEPWGRPASAPSCIHTLHLGRVGLVLNLNYMQMVDLLLGLFGADIAGDDGRRLGLWPWEVGVARQASEVAERLHTDILGQPLKPATAPEIEKATRYWGRSLNPAAPKPAAPTPPAKMEKAGTP